MCGIWSSHSNGSAKRNVHQHICRACSEYFVAFVITRVQWHLERMIHQNVQRVQLTFGDFGARNVIVDWFNGDYSSFCTNRNLKSIA